MKHIFTVDLEDWLQSSLALMPPGWVKPEMSMPTDQFINCTEKLLELLAETGTTATFFVLSSLADRYPEIIKNICRQGHEIASHGYGHELVYKMNAFSFKSDVQKSKEILENITGEKVLGYRAPYFSITKNSLWAIDVLLELGFDYDSSIFPISRKLYGMPGQLTLPNKIKENIWEFPPSTVNILGKNIPVAGGGYLRLFPFGFTKRGMSNLHRSGISAVLYMHPYELDTESLKKPLLDETVEIKLVRWTQNLKRSTMQNKLKFLMKAYNFTSIRNWLKDH
jgi:polysaccharide deacetylase family protein (PEP-CTERM system associated)